MNTTRLSELGVNYFRGAPRLCCVSARGIVSTRLNFGGGLDNRFPVRQYDTQHHRSTYRSRPCLTLARLSTS